MYISSYVSSWITRVYVALRGVGVWFKAGYLFILPPGILLLVIWLLGYGWIELTVMFTLGMIFIIAEMFNYAIERLCSLISPALNEDVRVVKDICAGAVAVSGTVLVAVGLYIIF